MKTIENIELLRKLQPILKELGVETEYEIVDDGCTEPYPMREEDIYFRWEEDFTFLKTLTLEEAIELLPDYIVIDIRPNEIWVHSTKYWYTSTSKWETPLQAIEKMLEYLIDNKHLWT